MGRHEVCKFSFQCCSFYILFHTQAHLLFSFETQEYRGKVQRTTHETLLRVRFHGLGSEVVDRLITSDTVIKKSISNEAKEPNNLDKVPPISLSETCVSDIERPEVKEPNNVAEISDNSSLSHSGDMYTMMMQES